MLAASSYYLLMIVMFDYHLSELAIYYSLGLSLGEQFYHKSGFNGTFNKNKLKTMDAIGGQL